MNIQQIYTEKYGVLEQGIAQFYNSFVKDIESDERFTLSDDEMTELFDELLLMYMHENMSHYEYHRVIDEISRK